MDILKSKKAWFSVLILVVLFVLLGFIEWGRISTPTFVHHQGWLTATSTEGIIEYPATLSTTYIHTQVWPPQVHIIPLNYTCAEAGDETTPAGKTAQRTISGKQYCVTTESEGAAGSVYNQYAYSFDQNGSVAVLTFSLREVQCDNYVEPEQTACKTERAQFDLDALVDQIAQTYRLGN